MKLKRLKKYSFLELTVASDVAFLLIIYFIVIAGFNINMGFLLDLPARDSSRLVLREDLLRFEMNREGGIIHEEEKLTLADTQILIQNAKKNNPNIAIMITIGGLAYWQNVVSFVELAQNINIDSFSFSMKKEYP
jgi:biopolymer transport protein ExbD